MSGMSQASAVGEPTAKDTLSQLIARILAQLTLSAWLPSAGLVLLMMFVYELAGHVTLGFPASLIETFRSLSKIGFGGLSLMVIAIVVATMLSQAFAFGSIRILEGYWGTSPLGLYLAEIGSQRQASKHEQLRAEHVKLRTSAWKQVRAVLRPARAQIGRPIATAPRGSQPPRSRRVLPPFSVGMLDKLRERIVGTPANHDLDAGAALIVDEFEWEEFVDRYTVHRIRVTQNRLGDYPVLDSHLMPTRLGNILRRAEVQTGQPDVEHFVDRVFDSVRFSLQVTHDEQRSRLDLYCSLVFVQLFAVIPTVMAFGWTRQAWLVSLALALAGSYVAYLAALASARYYGATLVEIADELPEEEAAEPAADEVIPADG